MVLLLSKGDQVWRMEPRIEEMLIWICCSGALLMIADFRQAVIQVFNSSFVFVRSFSDKDPALTGYAPFNVLAVGRVLYTTWAQQDPAALNPVIGGGGKRFRSLLV